MYQRRPRGRPPLRWADQIIKDTQMSLSDAVIATQDRPSWRSLVRDATRPAMKQTKQVSEPNRDILVHV